MDGRYNCTNGGGKNMDASVLYNQLMDEISEEEQATEQKRAHARFLRGRLDLEAAARKASEVPSTSQTPKDDVGVAAPPLAQLAASVVEQNGAIEFVVGNVNKWLTAEGHQLPKGANGKITVVLKKMFESGKLIRTFEGAGNVPHRYKLAAPTIESDQE